MAFYTGEVSKHHDSSHTNEILATADGATSVFSGRSANYPIKFGTVQIEFTIASVTHQVTEVGGTFTDVNIASGTIDEDGNYSFTFASNLDNGTPLTVVSYDTKGLLGKLLDLISEAPTKTVVGVGNGSTLTFSTTLAGTTISKGNCRLIWTSQGVTYDIWDNGEGVWEHEHIDSSSIDYTTRVVSVTFAAGNAPESATNIETWHIAENAGGSWMQMLGPRNQTDMSATEEPDHDGQQEVVLKNSGTSGKEEIVIGLREYSRASSDVHGISLTLMNRWTHQDDINGCYYFSGGAPHSPYNTGYDGTYNESYATQKFVISDDAMVYWINATKNRVVVVVRNAGSVYTNCYFGKGIPTASPAEHPKPYIVMGNTLLVTTPFSSTSLFSISRPAGSCFRYFLPDGQYDVGQHNGLQTTHNLFNIFGTTLKNTTTGKVHIQPIAIIKIVSGGHQEGTRTYMFLDGVYICPSNTIESENTINTNQFIAFQDIFRTTYNDYFCIAMG